MTSTSGVRAAAKGVSAASADAGAATASGDPLIVALTDGKLQGDEVGGTRRFLKIPFAKPPVGDLRWKAPVKNDHWQGVRHETDFADGCAQNSSAGSTSSNNEDCLYLNVWSPMPAPKRAPVMVWIHGGGNFAGATRDTIPTSTPPELWFDGQYFAARHGVVLVTIQYRLGPLGFFAHPGLAGEHSPLGNQGLLDQRAALEWVHANIAKFGGDPGNVTIFGESAGSADVCYHVASPGSRGLFQHAVSESGGCTLGGSGLGTVKAEDVADGMHAFAKAMGCEGGDELACLRQKSIDDVLTNAMQPDPMSGMVGGASYGFGVVIDGKGGVLPDQPRALFDAGDVAKVSYILGSNTDEGTLFLLNAPAITSEDDYMSALEQRFPDFAGEVAALYPASDFNGDYRAALARVIGDSGLVCGTHDSARRARAAGLHVFMYNFNMPWKVGGGALGASHASEISSVFGAPFMPSDDDQTVSDAMNAFWAAFARTGDPNFDGAPAAWPSFAPIESDRDQRLQFDAKLAAVDDFRRDECAFWRSHFGG